jgi:hypothetical protein
VAATTLKMLEQLIDAETSHYCKHFKEMQPSGQMLDEEFLGSQSATSETQYLEVMGACLAIVRSQPLTNLN